MATLIHQDTLNNTSDYPNTFVRTNAFPLERYSIFDTLTGAEKYATENPIAYIGQQLVVAPSDTATPSSFIISGGGNLVRIPDVYDLTSASDSLTADLSDHVSTSATTDTFGHVKLSNNDILSETSSNYGTIATNDSGQLVATIATSSSYGVVRACSNISQLDASPQHVIGLDKNGCVVLNISKNHSGFNIVGENALGSTGQQTILKVNTGTHPNSNTYHPTTDESSTVITNINGQLAVYPASASHYGVVKIGTDISSSGYSVVPNCASVNAAITSLSGSVNNKFLPLSGGTVTGSLIVNGKNNYISQLDFGGSAAEAGLKVRGISGRLHDRPEKGSLFINYDSKDVSHEEYWTYDTDDGRGLFICGSGNDSLAVRKKDLIAYSSSVSSAIETKISNEYLPLSGGTLSGNVVIGTETTELTEKLQVNGGIKSTSLSSTTLSSDNATINNTLTVSRLKFPGSISIGLSANNVYNDGSEIAIGQHSQTNNYSIAIGQYSVAEDNSINIGSLKQDEKTINNSISIGSNYTVSGFSVGIGHEVEANNNSISLGYNSSATDNSIGIGIGVFNTSDNSISIGDTSTASTSSITIGNNSQSYNDSITIGTSARSDHGSIVIGNSIKETSSNVIHIEANGDKVFDGNHGHASLIINGDGLTITHQLSSENNSWEDEPSKVTITANTLDKLNHIDTIVTSGSVNLIQSGAVYDFIHGNTVSIGSTTNTPSGTIEIVAIENELQNKLAVSSNGLTLAHPVSSSNENDEVVYSQDEVTLTADELKRIKNIENLKSTMVVREWDYTSTLPETTMTNNTMMIFRNWDLEQNNLDLIDEKLATV